MQAQAAYDELIRRTREASLLASCAELLGWDEEQLSVVVAVGSRSVKVFGYQVCGYPFLPHL